MNTKDDELRREQRADSKDMAKSRYYMYLYRLYIITVKHSGRLSSGSGTLDPLDQRGPQATRHLSLAFLNSPREEKHKSHLVRSCYRVPISMCHCKTGERRRGLCSEKRFFLYTLRVGRRVTRRLCARCSIRGGRVGGLG